MKTRCEDWRSGRTTTTIDKHEHASVSECVYVCCYTYLFVYYITLVSLLYKGGEFICGWRVEWNIKASGCNITDWEWNWNRYDTRQIQTDTTRQSRQVRNIDRIDIYMYDRPCSLFFLFCCVNRLDIDTHNGYNFEYLNYPIYKVEKV